MGPGDTSFQERSGLKGAQGRVRTLPVCGPWLPQWWGYRSMPVEHGIGPVWLLLPLRVYHGIVL